MNRLAKAVKVVVCMIFFLIGNAGISLSVIAGDLTVSSLVSITGNPTYDNITINAGGTLQIEAGAVLHCTNITIVKPVETSNAINLVKGSGGTAKLYVSGSINANGQGTIFSTSGYIKAGSVFNVLGTINLKDGSEFVIDTDLNVQPSGKILLDNSKLTIGGDLNFSGTVTSNLSQITVTNINSSASSHVTLSISQLTIAHQYNFNGILEMTYSQLTVNQDINIAAGSSIVDNAINPPVYPDNSITVKGSFYNNSTNIANTVFSQIILNGTGAQTITSLVSLTTRKFTVAGANTLKTVYASTTIYVNNTLNLNDAILDIQGSSAVYITNQQASSLTRTTGYINIPEWNGQFVRYTGSTQDYLFPVGNYLNSTNYYRPVIIRPNSTTTGIYSVKAVQGMYSPASYTIPTNIGSSLLQSNPPVGTNPYDCILNENFFHKFKTLNVTSPAADITVSYNPLSNPCHGNSPVEYNTLAVWNAPTNKWESATDEQNLLSSTVSSTEKKVTVLGYGLPVNTEIPLVLASINASQVPPVPYAMLLKKLDAAYYFPVNNKVYFKFEEEYSVDNGATLAHKIFDKSGNTYTSPTTSLVNTGDNRFQLVLPSLSSNAYYILEVTNSKQEKWYLRFKL